MDKIKIHELAKKLDVNSKLVVEKAQSLGMNVKSHLSTITTEEAEKITKAMGKAEKEKNEPKKEVTSKQPVIMRIQPGECRIQRGFQGGKLWRKKRSRKEVKRKETGYWIC